MANWENVCAFSEECYESEKCFSLVETTNTFQLNCFFFDIFFWFGFLMPFKNVYEKS